MDFEKMYLPRKQILRFVRLIPKIRKHLPDEIETKSNNLIVKTSTTEQLLGKFIPKISINLYSSNKHLERLLNFLPVLKGQYKEYIDYLIIILKGQDPIYTTNFCSPLKLIYKIIKANIEDDFSFVIPLISNKILKEKASSYIPKILGSLFISPPTRKKILDLLDSLFISLKKKYHPSNKIKFFDIFFHNIISSLQKGLIHLKKHKRKDKYYMDVKLGPSQEDIHKYLSIVCEITIMNIQNFINTDTVLKGSFLDTTLIDRYFEIEFQCINMTDAINVALNGWKIICALAYFIDKNDTIRDNFVNLFQIGVENFYNAELRYKICEFLSNCFQKVPFDNQKTLKGFENTDFVYLANLFFTKLFDIFRALPELEKEDEASQEKSPLRYFGIKSMSLDETFMKNASSCSNLMLRNCSQEVLSELLPIFTDLAYDKKLSHAFEYVKNIVSTYCIYANEEQAQKVINEFRKQLDLSSSNPELFGYYSAINAVISVARYRSIESVNKTVDLILPFTKNDDEKVRKAAWHSLYLCLSYFSFCCNAKAKAKSEDSPLISNFDDFEIEFLPVPDLSEKAYEVFGPIIEKLNTIKDQYEIISIINDIGDDISAAIQNIYLFTEGPIAFVYDNEISIVPQLTKKSVPIKDKFMESMCRIVHDFPENQTLVTQILKMVKKSIITENNRIDEYYYAFETFDGSKMKVNKEYMQSFAYAVDCNRKNYLVTPLSDGLKHFLDLTVDLLVSNSKEIRSKCSQFLYDISEFYGPYFYPVISSKIIEKRESVPIDVFVSFLKFLPRNEFLMVNDQLFCQTVLYLLKNFQESSKEKEFLDDLNEFIKNANESALTVPSESNKEYENFLNEIEVNYLANTKTNRSLRNVILQLIKLSLKHIKNINDNILKFIIDCITHYDQILSPQAVSIFVVALERRAKFTKERVEIKKPPTYETLPNILNSVTIKLPSNGFYFPSNNESFENDENGQDIDEIWSSLSMDYSIDIEPTASIDVNMDGMTENEDIKKVFETFKSIEIEWKMTEEERLLFDSEYMSLIDAGYFKLADHYHHKKYEFSENKILLEEIPNLFASAINSNNSYNEKIVYSNVDYISVWKQYALTVGPSCIKKVAKISRKYMVNYFTYSPEITARVLSDMIIGFLDESIYWTIQDRIQFYKLVVLPILCILSSNHKSLTHFHSVIKNICFEVTPFTFAPLIKVMFELGQIGSKSIHELVKSIPAILVLRPPFMVKLIDQLKAKYLDKINENSNTEISVVSYFLMAALYCLTYVCKGLPLYSDDIEAKIKEIVLILDKILQKENSNDFLTKFLIDIFQHFDKNSRDCQLLTAPIFIKNFHNIFQLLKSTKISTEDLFFRTFKNFLSSPVFFSNSSLKFEFLSSFISELMNSSLPAQLVLLDSVNDMIENYIFTFDAEEYAKYGDLFIKYGKVAKASNLGNEARLKIAKILGIFEIRKCSLKKWYCLSEKVDDSEVDDAILKAAAVVLNSYLFDKVDDDLKNALEILENLCMSRKKGSENYVFFTSVLQIFIIRHSGHVIKEAEELVIECQAKTSPSYVS